MGDREDFIVAAGAAVVGALADEADIHSRAGNSPPGRNHRRNGELNVVAGEVEVAMELAVLVAAVDEAEVRELHEVEEDLKAVDMDAHLKGAAISKELKDIRLEEHTVQEQVPLGAHTAVEEAGAEARETPAAAWEEVEERPEAGEETRASHLTE